MAVRTGSDSPACGGGRRPTNGDEQDPPAGLRHPRRHPDPDRPRTRPEAVLLRETPATWDERAGHRRPRRTPRLGVGGDARLGTRSDRRPHSRHRRGVDQRERDDLRGQGVPRRRRLCPHPVQASPLPAEAVPPAEGREQGPRPNPRPRRTRRRHPQDLESPDQTALLPVRTTTIVQAILALHHVENPTYRG